MSGRCVGHLGLGAWDNRSIGRSVGTTAILTALLVLMCLAPCWLILPATSAVGLHLRHTGETPYQCPHMACSLRFKWRSSLAHHARSVHGSFTPASSPSSVTISAGGGSGGPSPRNVTPLGDTGTSAADAVVARAAVVAGSAATAAAITAGGSGVAAPSGASLDGVPPPQDLNLCTRAADKDVTMRDASAGASLAVTPLPLPRPPPPRRHQSGWRPRGAGSRQPSGPRGPQ